MSTDRSSGLFLLERTIGSYGVGTLINPYLPVDLAFGSDGRLVVVDRGHSVLNGGHVDPEDSDVQAGKQVRVKIWTMDDDNLGQFGRPGTDAGEFLWPTAVAVDDQDRIYVSDEGRHDIQVFDQAGIFLHKWGTLGDGRGQLNRPSGLAILADGNVLVADCVNNRLQKFSPGGQPLATWGELGSSPGQLDQPWGLAVDKQGDVYVADWGNDRIQKFSPDGVYRRTFGSSGSGEGQLKRPSGVAVDGDGNVYVADLGNNRVQVFTPQGAHLATLLGDANLSKRAVGFYQSQVAARWEEHAPERYRVRSFHAPTAVKIDRQGRLLVVDSVRCRIQVYEKINLEPRAAGSPILASVLRSWSDSVDEQDRQRLNTYLPRVDTVRATPKDEERRAWLATDWLVRQYAAAWLDHAGLADQAKRLRELRELRTSEQAASVMPVMAAAERAAADAAVRAEPNRTRGAAWDVARAIAWPAARVAPLEGVAATARDAAGEAAWAAASDAVSLSPAVRESRFKLLDQMIAVGTTGAS